MGQKRVLAEAHQNRSKGKDCVKNCKLRNKMYSIGYCVGAELK